MKYQVRWTVGIFLFVAGIINYLDRSALSVAAPFIQDEMGLDATQLGLLFSSFFFGYVIMCFIGGWAADKFGPRKTFGASASFWSVMCGMTAFAPGFGSLMIARILFGIGEGPMGTTTNKSIANWFPRKEAARAVGITNAGQPLGAAIAAPIVGLIALQWGWRPAFVVIAVLGLVWAILWMKFFRDTPEQHKKISREELEYIKAGQDEGNVAAAQSTRKIWYYIFSLPILGVAIAFFCFNYVQYFFLTWLPSYFTEYQGLAVADMAVVTVLPWIAAAFGFIFGGTISDLIFRATGNVLLARKSMIFGGLSIAAACVFLSANSDSLFWAVTWIVIAALFAYMTPQACWALLQDVVPRDRVGAAGGFVHLLANLAGIIAPLLTGIIIQHFGGYNTAFVFAGMIAVVGVVATLLMISRRSVDRVNAGAVEPEKVAVNS